ncbi:MAG: hypothetical protein EHM15_09305, partial [Desulfobacteraceae bacterium]
MFALCLILLGLLLPGMAPAQKPEPPPRPERLLVMAAEYPGVVVPPGREVSMDLTFFNKGRTDETLDVRIARAPEGWQSRLKTYRF